MGLDRVATFKDTKRAAILLEVGGCKIELSHDAMTTYNTTTKVVAELERQASLSSAPLPRIFVHVNRDGSLALATGQEPNMWPDGTRAASPVPWETSHESGDLTDWTLNQSGEAVFNTGEAVISVEPGAAHTGRYGLKHEVWGIDKGVVATRIFRWAERLEEGCYSSFFMFPVLPLVNTDYGWFTLFQFKKNDREGGSDPTWIIGIDQVDGEALLCLNDWGHKIWNIPANVSPVRPLVAGKWFHVEAYYKTGVTDGVIRVWLDGVLTWDMQGVDTMGIDLNIQWAIGCYGTLVTPGNLVLYTDDCRIGLTHG